MMNKLDIKPFFDLVTNTVSYVLTDLASSQAAIIDPVLDFDPSSGKLTSSSADKVIAYLDENMVCDGTQFDHLFEDGEIIKLGHLEIQVMHTPGHTPACVSYKIDDAVFVGDTLFMPDFGTARTDFPSGSAKTLYQSIQRILSLSDNTRIFVGHDYKSATRDEHKWETTVVQEKHHNGHIKKGVTEAEFVLMRDKRDASLPVPRLLLPAIQLNIQAGHLPQVESNGMRYLKLPLSVELN
jgi:glyoxylase-like metal-dependent hydrolase (beta-lactamase superfamily II)